MKVTGHVGYAAVGRYTPVGKGGTAYDSMTEGGILLSHVTPQAQHMKQLYHTYPQASVHVSRIKATKGTLPFEIFLNVGTCFYQMNIFDNI